MVILVLTVSVLCFASFVGLLTLQLVPHRVASRRGRLVLSIGAFLVAAGAAVLTLLRVSHGVVACVCTFHGPSDLAP